MLLKGLDIGFKDVDTKQGVVSGYFAVFGNKDLDGDIIERGSFSKTVQERGPQGKQLIKYLLDHDKTKAVARIDDLYEDEKGLFYKAKIGSHSLGQDFAKMVDSGIINQHSFGFSIIKDQYDQQSKANRIKEVKMYEGSAIQFLGANPETTFIEMKSFEDFMAYFEKLEKFVKTSDATDETLIKLEEKLQSLSETIKAGQTTLNDVKADDNKLIIDLIKQSFKDGTN
jgi:HK97 family phage prohead protease